MYSITYEVIPCVIVESHFLLGTPVLKQHVKLALEALNHSLGVSALLVSRAISMWQISVPPMRTLGRDGNSIGTPAVVGLCHHCVPNPGLHDLQTGALQEQSLHR